MHIERHTNSVGESVVFTKSSHPLYGAETSKFGVAGSFCGKEILTISFEGLTGRAKKYVDNASYLSYGTIYAVALKMIELNMSCDDALCDWWGLPKSAKLNQLVA